MVRRIDRDRRGDPSSGTLVPFLRRCGSEPQQGVPMLFWLLVPMLAVLLAAPVFLAHVAAHLLMDRMRPRRESPDASAMLEPALTAEPIRPRASTA
jgi:hypothetical protein